MAEYQINKGVNKSVEFKGLKAQYIYYLFGGVVVSIVFYVIVYWLTTAIIALVVTAIIFGVFLFLLFDYNTKYGEHGLKKIVAGRKQPTAIKVKNTKLFKNLRNGKARK